MMTVEVEKNVMRNILIVGFDLIKNHNSYLFFVLFLFLIDSIIYILCFESEDKYDDNKN